MKSRTRQTYFLASPSSLSGKTDCERTDWKVGMGDVCEAQQVTLRTWAKVRRTEKLLLSFDQFALRAITQTTTQKTDSGNRSRCACPGRTQLTVDGPIAQTGHYLSLNLL